MHGLIWRRIFWVQNEYINVNESAHDASSNVLDYPHDSPPENIVLKRVIDALVNWTIISIRGPALCHIVYHEAETQYEEHGDPTDKPQDRNAQA